MALSGVHIVFGLCATSGSQAALPGNPISSDTMASAGTSTVVAPNISGAILLTITASVPIFYAIGKTPNATSGTRRYLGALVREDVFVRAGDKFAWIVA